MNRMMATGAMMLALLVAMPAFAGEPVRLAERDLDQVTAGWFSGDALPSFDGLYGITVPRLPVGGDPDDDIWDLMGSGVAGQSGLLERFRGFLRIVSFRQR